MIMKSLSPKPGPRCFPYRALLLALALGILPVPGRLLAQTAAPDSSGSRLRSFESSLRDTSRGDTASVRHHRQQEEEIDTTGSLLGDIIFFLPKEILKACFEGYCSLPGPNYGPYPYSSVSVFTAQYEKEPGNYLILGGSYSHIYEDIPSGQAEASLYLHSLYLGGSYQQFREKGERLYLTAIRIGSRKALGDYVLWQNHFGWRYMRGGAGMSGYLFGTQLRIFSWDRLAYNVGYDFDFFPEYGTAFHELDAGISYYLGRMEIKAGYQAKMIYEGPSLHGPYAGVNWNF